MGIQQQTITEGFAQKSTAKCPEAKKERLRKRS